MSDAKNPIGRELTPRERATLRRAHTNAQTTHGIGGLPKKRAWDNPKPITLRLPPEKR